MMRYLNICKRLFNHTFCLYVVQGAYRLRLMAAIFNTLEVGFRFECWYYHHGDDPRVDGVPHRILYYCIRTNHTSTEYVSGVLLRYIALCSMLLEGLSVWLDISKITMEDENSDLPHSNFQHYAKVNSSPPKWNLDDWHDIYAHHPIILGSHFALLKHAILLFVLALQKARWYLWHILGDSEMERAQSTQKWARWWWLPPKLRDRIHSELPFFRPTERMVKISFRWQWSDMLSTRNTWPTGAILWAQSCYLYCSEWNLLW